MPTSTEPKPDRFAVEMQARVLVEERELENAQAIQSEENDQHPADTLEPDFGMLEDPPSAVAVARTA